MTSLLQGRPKEGREAAADSSHRPVWSHSAQILCCGSRVQADGLSNMKRSRLWCPRLNRLPLAGTSKEQLVRLTQRLALSAETSNAAQQNLWDKLRSSGMHSDEPVRERLDPDRPPGGGRCFNLWSFPCRPWENNQTKESGDPLTETLGWMWPYGLSGEAKQSWTPECGRAGGPAVFGSPRKETPRFLHRIRKTLIFV